ncbi:MAG TPA: protein kinase [Ktedonobacteraceae bacterium]|nr:protein kinase [Ktedonobacteraceae bacterium]
MKCPRCGNEWDVSKSPCSRCGLLVHLPGRSGGAARNQSTPQSQQLQPGKLPSASNKSQSSQVKEAVPGPNSGISMEIPPTPFPRPQREAGGPANPSQPLGSKRASGVEMPRSLPGSMPHSQRPASPSSPNGTAREDGAPAGRTSQSLSSPGSVHTGQRPGSSTDLPLQKSVPSRPLDYASPDLMRQPSSLRPSRLVNDGIPQGGIRARAAQVSGVSFPTQMGSRSGEQAPAAPLLMPGTLLRNGRYRLRESLSRQEWLAGAYEAMWIAEDAQRSGARVMICEVVTPESGSMIMQSTLRAATMALTSVGRHPHIPTLWDAFSDQERNFFVFEPVEGESLLAHLRRTGRALPEQDVIECCLQMTEVLDLLAQQTPPLVHGLIRPEHIISVRSGSQYILTNFSIILAGGATQFIAGIDRLRLSPYMAPEFSRGVVDTRSDLYSLIATAYHVATGSVPAAVASSGSIPQAQRLNPNVSPQLDAILSKGLRPIASQRYQRPAELRQELLSMRSVSGSVAQRGASFPGTAAQRPAPSMPNPLAQGVQGTPGGVEQLLPGMMASVLDDEAQERRLLLPAPEDLPPLEPSNDAQISFWWLAGIIVCLILVVAFSRGLL